MNLFTMRLVEVGLMHVMVSLQVTMMSGIVLMLLVMMETCIQLNLIGVKRWKLMKFKVGDRVHYARSNGFDSFYKPFGLIGTVIEVDTSDTYERNVLVEFKSFIDRAGAESDTWWVPDWCLDIV